MQGSCGQTGLPESQARAPTAWWDSTGLLVALAAAVVLVIVTAESIVALAIAVMDGGVALAALGAAALAGGWIVQLLGLGHEPWRYRVLIGAALGIGLLSLMVLGLGSAGVLTRPVAMAVVVVLAVVGFARLALDLRAIEREAKTRPARSADARRLSHWLWLLVCPFLAIALLAACLPPGILWAEEGHAYDVLEYHLAAPKQFHDDGRITFLPNNVYASFPLNSEMLSLLMMTLRGDAIEASFMAQMANVVLAALFVAAAWLAGRTFSPRAGVVAGVLAGTSPWIAYLAGIAFVEIGMLAMGMCSLAAILRASRQVASCRRWFLAAGLLAGLSAGFKYTAVPLISLPLAMGPLLVRIPWPRRIAGVLLFTAGAAVTFTPWMVRNLVNTGNPIFPMAYSVFGAKPGTWDDALEANWQRAHGPEGEAARTDSTPAAILLFEHTIGDARMGVILLVLAVVGAAVNRDRWTLALTVLLVGQAVFWLAATHHYARFAVVMLLPLIVLAGRSFDADRTSAIVWLACGLLIAGTGRNLYHLGWLYYDHTRPGGSPIRAYGCANWFVEGEWPGMQPIGTVNHLGPSARVMLVGEARSFYVRRPCEYAVVFNHHPLAQAVRRLDDDATAVLAWLHKRGTTHVLVHWGEIERLRRSRYGFDPEIDRELFQRLADAGLIEVSHWGPEQQPIAVLYEVPPDE